MSRIRIPTRLRRQVIKRARECCEYCLLHQDYAESTHQIDHLIALKHGGSTVSGNLALACLNCNRFKGSDLTAIDPVDGVIVPLFNPRTQSWNEHFELAGGYLVGLTQTGRGTTALLRFNDEVRVNQRRILIEAGNYPPSHVSQG